MSIENSELSDLINKISAIQNDRTIKSVVRKTVQQLPDEERKNVTKDLMGELSRQSRKEIFDKWGIGAPGEKTKDYLWTIVIIAFSIVLVGTFITLAIGAFQAPEQGAITKPELVLTMFTSVVGFLAGLFVPSPAANRQTNG